MGLQFPGLLDNILSYLTIISRFFFTVQYETEKKSVLFPPAEGSSDDDEFRPEAGPDAGGKQRIPSRFLAQKSGDSYGDLMGFHGI